MWYLLFRPSYPLFQNLDETDMHNLPSYLPRNFWQKYESERSDMLTLIEVLLVVQRPLDSLINEAIGR